MPRCLIIITHFQTQKTSGIWNPYRIHGNLGIPGIPQKILAGNRNSRDWYTSAPSITVPYLKKRQNFEK
jgi:hypothetical protein